VRDYIELTQPRITSLTVMRTVVGYCFGHTGSWSLWQLVDRTKFRARRVLLAFVIYLPVLYAPMVLDPIPL
jgi:hypothetical protein